MILGLPDDDDSRALIESAFEKWASGADTILEPIAPGYSGSSLYKADVRQVDGARIPSGQYVLKLSLFSHWEDAKPEFDAHELAYKRDPVFSSEHIPRLIESYAADPDRRAGTGYAMLYEVAGGSLDRYAQTDTRQNGHFQTCAGAILTKLLKHWADTDVGERQSAANLLADLCRYRLTAEKAPGLHQFTAEHMPNLHFVLGDYVLINPLKFFELVQERGFGASAVLSGLLHGDLHGGNILLNLMRPAEKPFYVIDFALARIGAIGYDAAYLELAHALGAVGDQDPVLLVSALCAAEEGGEHTLVPGDAHWTRDLIVQLRGSLEEWRATTHPHRLDQIDRQLSLCRIAAGLNWANKPIEPSRRWAALCYAGWAARQYLRTHEPTIWESLGAPAGRRMHGPSTDDDDELWGELWAVTKGFDATQAKFILVAEDLRQGEPPLKALGQLPWSAVIDLDPKSDEGGLHYHAAPVLGARRGVHEFSDKIPTVDPRRGTGWMMAGGWSAKREYFPDPSDWRWERGAIVRDFVRHIAETVSPEPLHVIILPGATLDPTNPGARIGSIVASVDEASRGRAMIHLLGRRSISETARRLSRVPLEPGAFVRRVAEAFGTGFSARIAAVPGPNRQGRVIKLEMLRAMEENLHVLHSTILDDQRESAGMDSQFWRGRPPTWAELQAGLDIERAIHRDLVCDLAERLEMHRSQTVILEHNPGAGGTTAALRAAWDLRSRHPVAVLHKYSAALPDRLRELCQLTEQPVLLVAEASDLTESAREELYRYLSRNNCRVVLLYLRRTLSEVSNGTVHLLAPMDKKEADNFLDVYQNLATDRERKKQLEQITQRDNFHKYRLPFFYGLITFERDFLGVDRFVKIHTVGVQKSVRDLLERIAIVTIFSNGGLSLSLMKAMTDIDPQSSLTLEDVVGPDPARLLVERSGGVRFMHWTIADKVLALFQGGADDDWRFDLKAYAIDFIRSSVAAAGPEAMHSLLRQMFIDRIGGPDEDDRENFAPIIESLDSIDISLGHQVLGTLAEECPNGSHFWAHWGRHQVYRLKRDYEKAEEYLRRAVGLSPNDPLHHHTFGLVLRSQLRHRLKSLARDASVDDVFKHFNPLFEQAADEFGETRRLSPDNVYGYITHIQMIVMAAKELKRAAAADTIAGVGLDRPDLDTWLSENLAFAEDLLRDTTHLYATFERSDEYLTRCEADLDTLYGDLDAVVAIWEVANASGVGGARRRRALANAYLARKKRIWSDLDQSELRRVVDLMETNLRDSGRRDDDYELWFNAYMLLPHFDMEEALSQLAIWARKFPSWRAHYYVYVLQYLLWFEKRTDNLDAFEVALEECKKRHVGRRTYSPVWFGVSTGGSGLVPETDLGKWKKELDFFSNTRPLRRVNGMIEVVNGPQAGTIKIGGRVKAFFVPGRSFSANRNENNPVHFYLGFSPSGPRAWSVQLGRDGIDRVEDYAAEGSRGVHVSEPAIAAEVKRARLTTLRMERGRNFVRELVAAKARVGAKISVSDLERHLDALMGMAGAAKTLGINLADVLQAEKASARNDGELGETPARSKPTAETRLFGMVIVYDAKKNFGSIKDASGERYYFVRDYVMPVDRGSLVAGSTLVRFIPSSNEKGRVAQGIGIVSSGVYTPEGLVDDAAAPEAISRFALALVRKAPKGLPLSQLARRLEDNFWATGGLRRALAGEDVRTFIQGIGDLEISGGGSGLFVRLAAEIPFGPPAKRPAPKKLKTMVVPAGPKAKPKPASKTVSKPAALAGASPSLERPSPHKAEVKSVIIASMNQWMGEDPLTLAMVGTLLAKRFPGEEKIYVRLGYKNLARIIVDLGNIDIGPEPRRYLKVVKSKNE